MIVAPTTMVEAERVDIVYGLAEAACQCRSQQAAARKFQLELYLSKQSLPIIVGMGLLVAVTVIVAATVAVVGQNKNPSSSLCSTNWHDQHCCGPFHSSSSYRCRKL